MTSTIFTLRLMFGPEIAGSEKSFQQLYGSGANGFARSGFDLGRQPR